MKTTILGAGLAGISTSWHIGHQNCTIFEKSAKHGGHAGSESSFGFTYDHGPHVSFTKHDYVKQLFASNVAGEYGDFPVRTRNYYHGTWIEHPAQAHLWQVPESIRADCSAEMTAAAMASSEPPSNYEDWLLQAYGSTFARTFPFAYTRKYWTTEPSAMTTDWLGPRMPKLNVEEIAKGLIPDTYQNLHYITTVRYPNREGYQAFFEKMTHGANIHLNHEVASIDLGRKRLWFSSGESHDYEKLVSSLPLPDFISRCLNVPLEIRQASALLDCSQLLIVDVFAPHEQQMPGHWFYIYDEDKWATRIHCIERLSSSNAPTGWTGVQAEVYFSKHKPLTLKPQDIANEVAQELVTMGFVDSEIMEKGLCHVKWRWSPYANVIFTHPRREALDRIWEWLGKYGLERENDDLEAISYWPGESVNGSLAMAGRFAQWKYLWTDDCILRGKQLSQQFATIL